MKISFYFDEMLNRPLAEALIKRGFVVVLANDVGMTKRADEEHLNEATRRGMVLVTLDHPFAGLAAQQNDHAGVICWTPKEQNIGVMLRAFIELAEQHSAEQVIGRVFWLK